MSASHSALTHKNGLFHAFSPVSSSAVMKFDAVQSYGSAVSLRTVGHWVLGVAAGVLGSKYGAVILLPSRRTALTTRLWPLSSLLTITTPNRSTTPTTYRFELRRGMSFFGRSALVSIGTVSKCRDEGDAF
jgi:hypothetical protein